MPKPALHVTGMLVAVVCFAATPLAADEVDLATGETLRGQIVEQNDTELVLEHPVLGLVTVPADQVAAVRRDEVEAAPEEQAEAEEEQAASEEDGVEEAAEPEAEPEAPAQDRFLEGWDLSLSLGFAGTEGNSTSRSFNAQFKANKETEQLRWLFDNKYFFGSSDGTTTQNEFNSTLTRDWLEPGNPWFYFAKGIYDYNQFEPWDHRASAFGGAGYEFVKREDLAVNGRLGAGLTKEFGDEADDLRPEALIGLELLRWHITENQNLTAATTLYPDLSDLPENRVVSNIEWTVDIDHADGLKLKLGAEHEYESSTEGDADHNDLTYYGALTYDF